MTSQQSSKALKQVGLRTVSGFLACGFGSGLSPVAPGTAGSLMALPIAWVYLQTMPTQLGIIAAVLAGVLLLGIWCCDQAGKRLGQSDHPALVWDEFLGQWLVLLVVPVSWLGWLAAFILFRLFDIAKPWPVKLADQHVHGGLGVMLDDILAAGYAILLLLLLQYWWPDLLMV